MKKAYLVGQLNKRLQIYPGVYATAEDKERGVIGMCPLFSSRRKAEAYANGTKFPVIVMEIHTEGKA